MMRRFLMPILIVAATVAAYHDSFHGPFIFDDYNAIVDNPHIRRLWPLQELLAAPPASSVEGRPLVSLTLALNYAWCGLDVRGYHAVNLALHVLAALLLYGVVRRTLLIPRGAESLEAAATGLATAVAVLWAVHPLLTEAVNYIIQRTELLVGVFLLLTLYCFIRATESAGALVWYVLSVVSCALGMLCKEVMVVAPLIVLMYDRTFRALSVADALMIRSRVYAGLAATWVIAAAWIGSTGGRGGTVDLGFDRVAPWTYLATQTNVLLHYLRLAFWPAPLVLDYDDWPLARELPDYWLAASVVGVLVIATMIAAWRRSWYGFAGAWFFLILAPSSSIIPIVTEVAAERRMYLPLAAVVTVVVIGGYRLLDWLRERCGWRALWVQLFGIAVATVAATCLAVQTVRRTADYRTELGIWEDTCAKRPGNARALVNRGTALVRLGRVAEAEELYRRAIELKPSLADAHFNYGLLLAQRGDLAGAKEVFTWLAQHDARNARVWLNLGLITAQLGDRAEAARHLERAVWLDPRSAQIHNSLGAVYAQLGRYRESLQHLREAVRLDPNDASARANLGYALMDEDEPLEAIVQLEIALQLNPHDEAARRALASLRSNMVQRARAP